MAKQIERAIWKLTKDHGEVEVLADTSSMCIKKMVALDCQRGNSDCGGGADGAGARAVLDQVFLSSLGRCDSTATGTVRAGSFDSTSEVVAAAVRDSGSIKTRHLLSTMSIFQRSARLRRERLRGSLSSCNPADFNRF